MIQLYQMIAIGFVLSATLLGIIWRSLNDKIVSRDERLDELKRKYRNSNDRIESLEKSRSSILEEIRVLTKIAYKSTAQKTDSEEKNNKKKNKD